MTGGYRQYGRYLLASLTGNKNGNRGTYGTSFKPLPARLRTTFFIPLWTEHLCFLDQAWELVQTLDDPMVKSNSCQVQTEFVASGEVVKVGSHGELLS